MVWCDTFERTRCQINKILRFNGFPVNQLMSRWLRPRRRNRPDFNAILLSRASISGNQILPLLLSTSQQSHSHRRKGEGRKEGRTGCDLMWCVGVCVFWDMMVQVKEIESWSWLCLAVLNPRIRCGMFVHFRCCSLSDIFQWVQCTRLSRRSWNSNELSFALPASTKFAEFMLPSITCPVMIWCVAKTEHWITSHDDARRGWLAGLTVMMESSEWAQSILLPPIIISASLFNRSIGETFLSRMKRWNEEWVVKSRSNCFRRMATRLRTHSEENYCIKFENFPLKNLGLLLRVGAFLQIITYQPNGMFKHLHLSPATSSDPIQPPMSAIELGLVEWIWKLQSSFRGRIIDPVVVNYLRRWQRRKSTAVECLHIESL